MVHPPFQILHSLVERAAAAIPPLDLTEEEAGLLPYWMPVRLRPYAVESIEKDASGMLETLPASSVARACTVCTPSVSTTTGSV